MIELKIVYGYYFKGVRVGHSEMKLQSILLLANFHIEPETILDGMACGN